MATQLGLYNAALRHLKLRKLSALTDSVESRRILDGAYTNLLDAVLAQGNWKFAMRTSELSYDTDVTPTFGPNRAFSKPTDLVRLYALSTDEYLRNPLLDFREEAGYWYATFDTLYLSYVSNDASYGGGLSSWPALFTIYVEYWLACQVAKRLNPEINLDELKKERDDALAEALAKDAIAKPVSFPPAGNWVRARANGSTRRDRGHRGKLIG